MTTDGPIYIDGSTLDTVASCSTEAVLRYVLDYISREERADLKSGQAVHEVMAAWFKGARKTDALGILNASYHSWATENVASDDRLSYSNIHTIMSTWLDNHPVGSFPFTVKPENVEVGFSFPLDDDFIWVGRMDLLADDPRSGNLYVVDHKTTGRISQYWAKKFRLAGSITGYIWAAQQHIGNENVTGAYINAIELAKLPSDPSRKCKEHAVPYIECGPLHAKAQLIGPFTRTPQQIEEFKKTAIHLGRKFKSLLQRFDDVKRLHKVRMQGIFSNSCSFCQFYDFCAMGRPIDRVDSYLQKDRWEPFEYAFGHKNQVHSEGLNDSYGPEPQR